MTTFKLHPHDDLDSETKGAWRPTLSAGLIGPDGEHPETWNEGVVITCPECGCPQGVGFDRVKILPDGTTDGPIKCVDARCKWKADKLTFEGHASPDHGRKRFAEHQARARQEVVDARIRKVQQAHNEQIQKSIEELAAAEAKKTLGADPAKHPELFRKFMEEQRAKGRIGK